MAKAYAGKSGATSRIRFVMVDAEIAEGEIGPITQAIQNALGGPAPVAFRRLVSPSKAPTQEANGGHNSESETSTEGDQELVESDETPTSRQPRVRRAVSKTPKVVPIDMNEEVSLASFAKGKDAKSQNKKFLIAAAWLKEHRGVDAVTDGHIYTCFKSMGWSTNIPDFSQPLRDLKAKHQYFEKSDKGYEINHLGLDYVKKLGGGNGAD